MKGILKMKKILALLLSVMLLAGIASAEETQDDFLGKPFPDFTVTDTEGNSFTLSEALKDHEAVLINFWATWCGPCNKEFPYLNEAYGKYRDRVAFIALSTEKKDTIEEIEAYRKENGIDFPMARDEGGMYRYIAANSIPKTVVVDRFGNAAFYHNAFTNAKEVGRALDTFLGDGYTETKVLNEIPRDTSTRSFPASAARAVYPESGSYKKVILYMDAYPKPIAGYIVPDDSVRLRIEIAADDDVDKMEYADLIQMQLIMVPELLDPERGIYTFDQPMPEEQYGYVSLSNRDLDNDENEVNVYLFRNEESISALADLYASQNLGKVRWEYADEEKKAEGTPQAYILHVADQDGNPVEGVSVNFCTDEACVPKESDEDGLVTFTGEPDAYHVTIVDVPEGYSWDENYEMYTTREYGEWVLRVRKD